MSPNLSISEAQYSDLPEIVALRCEAEDTGILMRFIFGHDREERFRKQTESLMGSLGKRFTEPTNRCYILKVVDDQTDEIVGWGLIRWEDGSWLVPPPENDPSEKLNFVTWYGREIRSAWVKLLPDKQPHVVIGAMYTKVNRQGHGIGRKLMEHLISTYNLDKELVIAQTNPIAEGFYQAMGFKTAGSTNTDLSKWAPEGRGYGLHRCPQMMRYPRSSVTR